MRVAALLLFLCHQAQPLLLRSPLCGALSASCTRRRRHLAPSAKAAEFFFEQEGETLRFGASQSSINMIRPEASGTLEEFITSDPKGIALSSWRADQITQLDDGTFMINVEQFNFLSLKVAVALNARVWLDEATSTANFESSGFSTCLQMRRHAQSARFCHVSGWLTQAYSAVYFRMARELAARPWTRRLQRQDRWRTGAVHSNTLNVRCWSHSPCSLDQKHAPMSARRCHRSWRHYRLCQRCRARQNACDASNLKPLRAARAGDWRGECVYAPAS